MSVIQKYMSQILPQIKPLYPNQIHQGKTYMFCRNLRYLGIYLFIISRLYNSNYVNNNQNIYFGKKKRNLKLENSIIWTKNHGLCLFDY